MTKHILGILAFASCCILISCPGCGSRSVSGGAKDVDTLVAMFKEACRAQDLAKLRELSYWEDIPENEIAANLAEKQQIFFSNGITVKDVKATKFPDPERLEANRPVKMGKVIYRPTVDILGQLEISTEVDGKPAGSWILQYGTKGKRYFISTKKKT